MRSSLGVGITASFNHHHRLLSEFEVVGNGYPHEMPPNWLRAVCVCELHVSHINND